MAKLLCLLVNAFVLIQLARAQPKKTAWAAANAGMGLGTTAPPDPTEHQINMAIVGINNAKTEAQAAQAAAAIYSPALDLSDNVKQALENKIRQLRTPAGWQHPIPPPLPFGFDVMHVIMNAFYGGPVTASPMATVPVAPAGRRGPKRGPPTSIRRGPPPGAAYMPGGAMSGLGSMGPMGGGGLTGVSRFMEPTNWEVELAVHNVNAATTEAEAAKAAAAVYRIGLDAPDAVVSAFEEKVARLRNPNWTGRNPPPLPRTFRPMSFIIRAWKELQTLANAQAAAQNAAAANAARGPPPGAPPKPAPAKTTRKRPSIAPKVKTPKRKSPPPTRAQVEMQLRMQEQQAASGNSYFNNFVQQNRRNSPPPPAPRFPNLPNYNMNSAQMSRPIGPRYQLSSHQRTPSNQPRYHTNAPRPNTQQPFRRPNQFKPMNRVDPILNGGPRKTAVPPVPPTRQTDMFKNVNGKTTHKSSATSNAGIVTIEELFGKRTTTTSTKPPVPSAKPKTSAPRYHTPPVIHKSPKQRTRYPAEILKPPPKSDGIPKPPSVITATTKKIPRPSSIKRPGLREHVKSSVRPTRVDRYGPTNPVPSATPPTPKQRKATGFVRDSVQLRKVPSPTFKPTEKRPAVSPSKLTRLQQRYPGLKYKRSSKQHITHLQQKQNHQQQLDYYEGTQNPARMPIDEPFADIKSASAIPSPRYSVINAQNKPKPKSLRTFKKSHQIWSPSGNLGLGINNILKSSIIVDGLESVPIPTKSTVPPPPPPTTTTTTPKPTTTTTTTLAPTTTTLAPTTTTTTTTQKPTTTTTTTRSPPTTRVKSTTTTVSKTKPPAPTDASATKAGTQLSSQDKLKELENLLRGISPGELESLVNIIKAKATGGPAAPVEQGPPPPQPQPRQQQPREQPPAPYEPPRRQPPSGYIPPPPGSDNMGPSREMRMGPPPPNRGPQRGPPPQGYRGNNGPPMGNNQGGHDNQMPPWARNGPQMGGPQRGGPPMGGPPMRGPPGRGGPMGPGGPMGMGPGGQRGPGGPGGLDPNNPQVARLIRVISKRIPDMLAGRTGGSRNPVTGEQPEPGEGGGMMNPMMMAMMMNGGQGGAGGPDLSALLGGMGGSGGGGMGALASLFGGGGGGGGSGMGGLAALGALGGGSGGSGGNPMAMLQALGGGQSSGGAAGEGGMNPLMAMLAGGGGSGGSGGMGPFGALNFMGGMGGSFGAM